MRIYYSVQQLLATNKFATSGAESKLGLVWRVPLRAPFLSIPSLPFSFLPCTPSLPFPPFFPLPTLTPPLLCTPPFPLEAGLFKSS